MDNSYGFKIPKDEVAHSLPLAAAADIAQPALVARVVSTITGLIIIGLRFPGAF